MTIVLAREATWQERSVTSYEIKSYGLTNSGILVDGYGMDNCKSQDRVDIFMKF